MDKLLLTLTFIACFLIVGLTGARHRDVSKAHVYQLAHARVRPYRISLEPEDVKLESRKPIKVLKILQEEREELADMRH